MPDPIAGILRKPFAEQIAAFRLRLGDLVPTSAWDDISRSAHDRAFMVAGATKADLLADLAVAVDKAIAAGTGLEEFRRDFRQIVERHGWHGWTGEDSAAGRAWRTRVIYRTNMATTYAAGRLAQLREANFPLWVYRHGASREPRIVHLSWNGLVLKPSHPFWTTHYPPSDWGCSCYVIGARSAAGARRVGGDPDKPLPDNWNKIDPKTGAPIGVGRNWDYAPGASVSRTISSLAEKLARLPAPLGADMIRSWPDHLFALWSEMFGSFVDTTLSQPPRGQIMTVGSLHPEWIAAARARGVAPETAEIVVRDRDIWHSFRDSKKAPLPLSWYRALPQHLRTPDLVLLDQTHDTPAMLLLFDLPDMQGKLVVRLDYRVKKLGRMNILETGRIISDRDVWSLIGQDVTVIQGNV